MRLALLLLSATPAWAEPPLTAEAFDTLTMGRTMTWAEHGQIYGVEQYLEGRRVRWTVLGDDCKAGHWYQDGAMICFLYEDDPAPEPVVVEETIAPMACFGPEVGA